MKINMSPIQVQKTILAPTMQQSIEILLLPIAELNAAIEQELQENPLLEVDESRKELDEAQLANILKDKFSTDYDKSFLPSYDYNPDDESINESPISQTPPLEDYLLRQLKLEVNDPMELKIGELIIGELNEDGYFKSSCEEIAQLLNLKSIELVEKVLKIIQMFDPLGIASRNLRECLITQINYKLNGNGKLACTLVNNFLKELGNKKYQEIARQLKIPIEKVKEINHLISTFEPKPARNFRPISENIYIKPDVYVIKDEEGKYHIYLNNENIPKLRINKFYKNLLDKPNRTEEEKSFIFTKIKNALLFMKSLEQRNQTIKEITKYIVKHQEEFFEQGHLALKPLKLKDVAEVIDRNESTVCRAINQKYMDTPQGLYSMKFFFSQGLSSNNREDHSVSSRSVKEELKSLVEAEDKDNPLSDQEIRLYFEKQNMKVARRTISKYRQALKILPSHLRKV